MKKKERKLREEILEGIDISRIYTIPVPEKFRIVGFIQLIAEHSKYIEEHGINNLRDCEVFHADPTIRLLSPLLVEGVDFVDMKEIMLNYLDNFTRSNIYYAKFAVTSIGILAIKKQLDHLSIFHLLLSLLGVDFLTKNLKYVGYKMARNGEFESRGEVRYKEYEVAYRELKYSLIALRLYALKKGFTEMEEYLYNHYPNQEVVLLYRILKNTDPALRYSSYRHMVKDGGDMEQMILAGVYSILAKKSIMTCHYMMNSMIGKYSYFDQKPEEVEQEVRAKYKEMRKVMKDMGVKDEQKV
ncbi:MAG: hypothetical protein CSB16_01215 [Clostridiales bacterium]|nr:MAG: hypothetical protein CSB16_01215 [Clostridiales bacterium]